MEDGLEMNEDKATYLAASGTTETVAAFRFLGATMLLAKLGERFNERRPREGLASREHVTKFRSFCALTRDNISRVCSPSSL